MRWWSLQDPEDREPYAVIAEDGKGLPRRFVPGMGLVHWPSMAMYTLNGETGAQRINQGHAVELMKAGIGAIDPSFIVMSRGTGPDMPAPGGVGKGKAPDRLPALVDTSAPPAATPPPAAAPAAPAGQPADQQPPADKPANQPPKPAKKGAVAAQAAT